MPATQISLNYSDDLKVGIRVFYALIICREAYGGDEKKGEGRQSGRQG